MCEIRELSALYRSDDEWQALRIITDELTFQEPRHRSMLRRVADAWKEAHDNGGTLPDALRKLDDDEAWWIRCQLPTAVSEISATERCVRLALAALVKEVSRG